jgi:hypothetical protein
VLEVRTEDVLWYADHSLDEMVAILRQLGDETANRRPRLPGANSPFAIVTHCLGVMEFWAGAMIADRPIVRDRDAEFSATGAVEELVTRTAAARRQLAVDLESLAPLAPPRRPGPAGDAHLPFARTQGGVVLHILEELMQHLGQLELTRDLLDAERTAPPT